MLRSGLDRCQRSLPHIVPSKEEEEAGTGISLCPCHLRHSSGRRIHIADRQVRSRTRRTRHISNGVSPSCVFRQALKRLIHRV